MSKNVQSSNIFFLFPQEESQPFLRMRSAGRIADTLFGSMLSLWWDLSTPRVSGLLPWSLLPPLSHWAGAHLPLMGQCFPLSPVIYCPHVDTGLALPYPRTCDGFCFPEIPHWSFPKIPHCWTSSKPLRCVCHPPPTWRQLSSWLAVFPLSVTSKPSARSSGLRHHLTCHPLPACLLNRWLRSWPYSGCRSLQGRGGTLQDAGKQIGLKGEDPVTIAMCVLTQA